MATATAMYHSGKNPLKKVTRDSEPVDIVKGERRRRLHKAFLRYHDPNNWPLLRETLKDMGRADLIGNGKHHLIPTFQPATDGGYESARRKNSTQAGQKVAPNKPRSGQILTQHTGLPPRETGAARTPQRSPATPFVKTHGGTAPKAGAKAGAKSQRKRQRKSGHKSSGRQARPALRQRISSRRRPATSTRSTARPAAPASPTATPSIPG